MNNKLSIRKDWALIESLIDTNSKVLDIGCGEGGLMAQLEKNIKAKTNGIEVSAFLAQKAIAQGFNVVQGNAALLAVLGTAHYAIRGTLTTMRQKPTAPSAALGDSVRNVTTARWPLWGVWRIAFGLCRRHGNSLSCM